MTTRLSQINTWISSLLPDLQEIIPLQADASSRDYYRVVTKTNSYCLMDTEPGTELLNFLEIADLLKSNCTVPTIIHKDLEQGLLLLTDFGKETYFSAISSGTPEYIDQLYMDAILALANLQTIKASLPIMGIEYINEKLSVFDTWYIQKHLQIQCDPALLEQLSVLFFDCFQAQPQVLVHVDYHCRNLMVLPTNNPGVIDFQDAMLGPYTYDLVSLLQDAYVVWPRVKVEAWIRDFANVLQIEFNSTLVKHFDIVGLQRHLKNLGVFARLHYRDNKSHYLPHIPTLLEYINSTCERYPELAKLHTFLEKNVYHTIKEVG